MSDTALMWQEIRAIKAQLERIRKTDRPGVASTWTPVLAGTTGGGTFTYTVQAGNYTRTYDRVYFQCRVTITAITVAPTGNMQITGLPITAASPAGSNNAGGGCVALWQGFTFPANYTQLMGAIVAGSSAISFIRGGSNQAAASVAAGELALVGGAASWQIFGEYQV